MLQNTSSDNRTIFLDHPKDNRPNMHTLHCEILSPEKLQEQRERVIHATIVISKRYLINHKDTFVRCEIHKHITKFKKKIVAFTKQCKTTFVVLQLNDIFETLIDYLDGNAHTQCLHVVFKNLELLKYCIFILPYNISLVL